MALNEKQKKKVAQVKTEAMEFIKKNPNWSSNYCVSLAVDSILGKNDSDREQIYEVVKSIVNKEEPKEHREGKLTLEEIRMAETAIKRGDHLLPEEEIPADLKDLLDRYEARRESGMSKDSQEFEMDVRRRL